MIDRFEGRYGFLSNFYESFVLLDGITYATVENAYQAAKTTDPAERVQFFGCSPGKAKRKAQHVLLRPGWDSMRNTVMLDLLRQKFVKGSLLGIELVKTGNQQLIEGNTWHDNYWGACMCTACLSFTKHNNLGKLLMRVREEIR